MVWGIMLPKRITMTSVAIHKNPITDISHLKKRNMKYTLSPCIAQRQIPFTANKKRSKLAN